MRAYDLLIIGTGPAGVQAAYRAVRAGRRVAVVDRKALIGGVCIHTGTIPSKTLRQAVVDLTGYRTWGLYRTTPDRRPDVPMGRLLDRVRRVIDVEMSFQEQLLRSRGVELITGTGRLLDAHTVRVTDESGGTEDVRGEGILIAVGTVPRHPSDVPFDGRSILDTDDVLKLERLPRSLIIVGAGVIGSEYASILSLLDCEITLLNRTDRLLPFIDPDLVAELGREMTSRGVTIRTEAEVEAIEQTPDGGSVRLRDGSVLEAEAVLYCAGRQSSAPGLDLEAAGLDCETDGRLRVDADFRTAVPSIFAAGDVIGFPSLASASREQGRVAACRALGIECRPVDEDIPFGIYTVPEIATVGPTEAAAARSGLDVVAGVGRYEDTARGQIIGDTRGMLKLVVDRGSRRLLGAHMIGTGATELIHLALTAIAHEASYLYFVRTVMNYPTLSRVYKLAAWDLLETLGD